MRLHCISLSVMPVVLRACVVLFFLPISELPLQLGEGLGRTGGWGHARGRVLGAVCVCAGETVWLWCIFGALVMAIQ